MFWFLTHTLTCIHLTYMIRRQVHEVLSIDAGSFSKRKRWTEEGLLRRLRKRNCIGIVATFGDTVVGFCVYELNLTHFRILRMAVSPDWRHRNIGDRMIQRLGLKLTDKRNHVLASLPSNAPSGLKRFFSRYSFVRRMP